MIHFIKFSKRLEGGFMRLDGSVVYMKMVLYLTCTTSLYLLMRLRSLTRSSRSRSSRSPKVQSRSNFLRKSSSLRSGRTVAESMRFFTGAFSGTQLTRATLRDVIVTSLKLNRFTISRSYTKKRTSASDRLDTADTQSPKNFKLMRYC